MKNMTRKLIDTDTVGKTGTNLGTLEFQAETDRAQFCSRRHIFLAPGFLRRRGHRVLRGSTKRGGQGRLAMRYVNLSNGRHHNERFVGIEPQY